MEGNEEISHPCFLIEIEFIFCRHLYRTMRLNTPQHWESSQPQGNEKDRYSKRFVSVHDFRRIGSQLLSKNQFAYDISDEDMVYEFGATPLVLTKLWKLLVIETRLPENSDPLHLLWWLHFAKHYHKKKRNLDKQQNGPIRLQKSG
jgi:hypothetical protein